MHGDHCLNAMKTCREDIVKTEAGTGVLNCKSRTLSGIGLQPKPGRGKDSTGTKQDPAHHTGLHIWSFGTVIARFLPPSFLHQQ